MHAVFELLVRELERPRPLTPQVLRTLEDLRGVGREEAPAFLATQLVDLAEDELDLLLSPLFTPKLADQAVFAAELGTEALSAATWPGLIRQLADRPTRGCVVDAAGGEHRFPLQPVTLERYVHRLRLDGSLSEPVFRLISTQAAAADRPLLLAIARRAVWATPGREEIFRHFLGQLLAGSDHRVEDAGELLQLMETSAPADRADLLARIPQWEEIVRSQLADTQRPRPFFSDRLQEMHGGTRDQRGTNEAVLTRKQAELAFFGRLRGLLT